MAQQDQYASLRDVVCKLLKGESSAQIFTESNNDVSFEQIQDLEVLINNENPIAALEKDGQASELKYNLPASTEYQGLHFIILSAPGLQGPNFQWYKPHWVQPRGGHKVPPPDTTSSNSQSNSSSKSGYNPSVNVGRVSNVPNTSIPIPPPKGDPLPSQVISDRVKSMYSMQAG